MKSHIRGKLGILVLAISLSGGLSASIVVHPSLPPAVSAPAGPDDPGTKLVPNGQAKYDAAIAIIKKTPRGKAIVEELENSPKKIGVLVVDQEGAGVDSTWFAPCQKGTEGCEGIHLYMGQLYDGGWLFFTIDAPMTYDAGKKSFPVALSLLHELGHALAYKNNPAAVLAVVKAMNDAAKKGDATGYSKAKYEYEDLNVAENEIPVCKGLADSFKYSPESCRKKYD